MKRLSITALAVAAVGFSGVALADPEIFSPAMDEKIYSNTLGLVATDTAAAGNSVQWAVRINNPGCLKGDGNINNLFGNVDGMSDSFDWVNGIFGAMLDISSLAAGEYCFAFNTTSGPAGGSRLVQDFYIVDTYAKVSGGFRFGENPNVPGSSPTHTFEGYVADAGASGLLGAFHVNYRELGVTCTFTPGAETFIEIINPPAANGDHPVGVRAIANKLDGSCSDTSTTSNARFFILEKGSVLGNRPDGDAGQLLDAPRGAVVLRFNGTPSVNDLEIDATAGTTGVESWILLERGNGEVGVR